MARERVFGAQALLANVRVENFVVAGDTVRCGRGIWIRGTYVFPRSGNLIEGADVW